LIICFGTSSILRQCRVSEHRLQTICGFTLICLHILENEPRDVEKKVPHYPIVRCMNMCMKKLAIENIRKDIKPASPFRAMGWPTLESCVRGGWSRSRSWGRSLNQGTGSHPIPAYPFREPLSAL